MNSENVILNDYKSPLANEWEKLVETVKKLSDHEKFDFNSQEPWKREFFKLGKQIESLRLWKR